MFVNAVSSVNQQRTHLDPDMGEVVPVLIFFL